MGDRIEVRVDANATAGLDVYFQQGERRLDAIYFDDGRAEEYRVDNSFITETISGWAKVTIRRTHRTHSGEPLWEVACKTNVVNDDVLEAGLARIKKRIEQIIRTGLSGSSDITDDLGIPGWEISIR